MKYLKKYDYDLLNDVISLSESSSKIDWKKLFTNDNPLVIEIGCGNGHFLATKAKNDPNNNHIGIDIKQKRIIRCREKQTKHEIKNITWIWGEALSALKELFSDNSISVIYMPFPDPWPKNRHHKHRLFKEDFVQIVYNKLIPNGSFIFITDHSGYFESSHKLIEKDKRFEITIDLNMDDMGLTESIFGEKWKKDNRDFYYFCIKKKVE